MERQELVRALESRCEELQSELDASQRALVALRGVGRGKGPIVLGAKKSIVSKDRIGKLQPAHHNTGPIGAAVERILRSKPLGITVREIRERLTKAGFSTNDHTVHNSFRRIGAVSVGKAEGAGGQTALLYSMPANGKAVANAS